jgi:glutaredoxin
MRVTIGAVLLAASLSAGAQMYRWTDSTGKTHYTDTLPPASARNVERRDGREGNISAGSTAEPHALQLARKKSPVKLYSTPGCEACDAARSLLNARGVPFSEVSVGDADSAADLKKTVGSNSVPALIVGGTVQRGFEEGLYHRTLDAAGYPKPGILPARNQAEPKPGLPADEPQPEEAPAGRGPYAPRR